MKKVEEFGQQGPKTYGPGFLAGDDALELDF
jgi:hypothetical protein